MAKVMPGPDLVEETALEAAVRRVVVVGMVSALSALFGAGLEPVRADQATRPVASEQVITEQNLFHPSRSVPAPPPPAPKAPPAPVAAPSPPPPAPKFVLSGVVIDGETQMVILLEPKLTENKPRLVSPGQPVGPYRLTTVRPDQVTLAGPVGEVVVLLHDPQKPKPPPLARASVARPRAEAAPAVELTPPEGEPPPAIQVPRGDPRRTQGFKSLLDALPRQPQAGSPAQGSQ